MSARVLLTGATGFVGRQVLAGLIEKDIDVKLVVRDTKAKEVQSEYGLASVVTTADLFKEDARWWQDVLADVDTLVHLAWYAEPGEYLQSARNIECLRGTLAMAQGAVNAGVSRFVGVGTCFEYDLSAGLLTTETRLSPLTTYAGCKAGAYLALLPWLESEGIAFSWCRLFYLYGEGEDSRRLVPYLRNQMSSGEMANLTSGNQVRDFLDVSVAGRMIVDVALGSHIGAINICSGVGQTVRELADSIADEYGRRDLLNFGARPDNLVDPPCVIGCRPDMTALSSPR